VKRAGALKLHAREQPAIIQNALGKQTEAIALYEVILTAKPPADPELRAAALVGKGDTLMGLSRNDPQQVETAIVTFSQLAADQEASASRRYQALYEKGRALDQAGRKTEAVATFNEALDQNLAGAQREFFWFYKSGFEAARHYEQQSAWPAAIAIYEKMARIEGPRAEEAKRQAKQLRLEHFVWD
jgi:tetratricopeptide (TPR) repeat protein